MNQPRTRPPIPPPIRPLIRPLLPADWPAVRAIWAAGIATGDATFEVEPPAGWAAFDAARLPAHRFVALDPTAQDPTALDPAAAGSGRPAGVVGWIAVAPVSARPAYAGVVEHSVYVDPAVAGRGIGRALLDVLIASTEAAGIWTIQSAIFPENRPSVTLHARAGFRTVGRRERIARRDGRWRDVLLLERRSPVVG